MVFDLSLWINEPALRGEAALKVRQPKEARKNATITPCERSFSDSHWPASCQFGMEEPNLPLEGELVQCARNGKPILLKLGQIQDWLH